METTFVNTGDTVVHAPFVTNVTVIGVTDATQDSDDDDESGDDNDDGRNTYHMFSYTNSWRDVDPYNDTYTDFERTLDEETESFLGHCSRRYGFGGTLQCTCAALLTTALEKTETLKYVRSDSYSALPNCFAQLCGMLGRCTHLSWLDLTDNTIDESSMAMLARAFSGPGKDTLVTLRLSDTRIDTVSCVPLAALVRCSTRLEILDVSYTRIGDAGIEMLVAALAPRNNLKMLYCDDAWIGVVGATCVARAIESGLLGALVNLRFDDNQVCDEGARAFARALACNTSLVRLTMCRCEIGKAGVAALVDVLEMGAACALQHDEMRRIALTIGQYAARILERYVHCGNRTLDCLELYENHIGRRLRMRLARIAAARDPAQAAAERAKRIGAALIQDIAQD